MIRKLQKYLRAVRDSDMRESNRATSLGVTPVLFMNLGGTDISNQFQVLMTRAAAAVTAKVGGASNVVNPTPNGQGPPG